MYISAWITDLNNRNILNVSFASPIMTCIMELQKALSDLDKLATTPIPSAYSFHLRLTVMLYLFFLPFQLQQYLHWVTIPATAIASIVYLGFLEIGNQIEMPFAYDQSDLDLDKYVLKIAHQLAQVTAVGGDSLRPCRSKHLTRIVPDISPYLPCGALPPEPTVPPSHLIERPHPPRFIRSQTPPDGSRFRKRFPSICSRIRY